MLDTTCCKGSQEKMWVDLNADEKIERLRSVIKSMQEHLDWFNEELNRKASSEILKDFNNLYGRLNKMEGHKHDAKGNVVSSQNEYF